MTKTLRGMACGSYQNSELCRATGERENLLAATWSGSSLSGLESSESVVPRLGPPAVDPADRGEEPKRARDIANVIRGSQRPGSGFKSSSCGAQNRHTLGPVPRNADPVRRGSYVTAVRALATPSACVGGVDQRGSRVTPFIRCSSFSTLALRLHFSAVGFSSTRTAISRTPCRSLSQSWSVFRLCPRHRGRRPRTTPAKTEP
jgi:hypothetical protein